MSLKTLLIKGALSDVATANHATNPSTVAPVAPVAPVAVASNPSSLQTNGQLKLIRQWLKDIDEKDPVIIQDIMERCRNHLDVREYVLKLLPVNSKAL